MSAPVRIPKSSASTISKTRKSPQPRTTPSTCAAAHPSPKQQAAESQKDSSRTNRRHSRPDLMSSSLKAQDDYLVYEIPSRDSDSGHGSVVIIPKSSQGFSWNEGTPRPTSELIIDVFLSKYHLNLASPIRLSSSAESGSYQESTDGDREEDFVDVHEIHIDEDDHTELWWGDLA